MAQALAELMGDVPQHHRYSVFGLSIKSELPLPELFPQAVPREADVEIVIGSIPVFPNRPEHEGFSVTDFGGLLTVAGVGRYLISDGCRITVEPAASGSDRHLRLYLLGSAFGVLLHQRHLLPLHANVVDVSGRAVAFMGKSGAGKSTMAAWFYDRGYSVLADDVCVITGGEGGQFSVQPGIPRLRLWRDALERSGRSADDYDLAFDDADKYNVATRDNCDSHAIPLCAVYLLDDPDSQAQAHEVNRLRGVDAMGALVANTYRGAYAPMLGALPQLIASCQALAAHVPTYAVKRVWGKEHLTAQLTYLERHALATVASPEASIFDHDQTS